MFTQAIDHVGNLVLHALAIVPLITSAPHVIPLVMLLLRRV
eukprot:COSAG02_NODE_17459_length_1001_cov_1.819290_2_plen_40_part_01